MLILASCILFSCQSNDAKKEETVHLENLLPVAHQEVKRVGMVVKVKKEYVEEYKKLHADNNPGVRHLLTKYHLRNFSIYMVQLADGEWYEFGYYEYWGNDFESDMAKLDAEPENVKWLELCDPMQDGIFLDQKGWKQMNRVYYNY
ncbi:MAG: L-rhamnose mutarotase [Bacteroidetes bacterium]|nr:L-rhamnose mutarotase [Bacteroidota bacterium]